MNFKLFLIIIAFSFNGKAFSQSYLAENFTLTNDKGELVNSDEFLTNGNNKVILFWSRYCGLCKLEMKGIRNVGKEWFKDYNAEVIFVSLENYPSDSFEKLDFLSEFKGEGIYRLFDKNMGFYRSFDTEVIPTTVLLNGEGEIVQKWMAYDDGLESSIGMYFKKLHAEKSASN